MRLFRRARSANLPQDWEVYKRFRNLTTAKIEKRKQEYFRHLHITIRFGNLSQNIIFFQKKISLFIQRLLWLLYLLHWVIYWLRAQWVFFHTACSRAPLAIESSKTIPDEKTVSNRIYSVCKETLEGHFGPTGPGRCFGKTVESSFRTFTASIAAMTTHIEQEA